MKRLIGLVTIAVLMVAGVVHAAETDEAATLRREVESLAQRVKDLESTTTLFDGGNSWVDRFSFSGDFRYRTERINTEEKGEDPDVRIRQRIRARLNMKAQVNDEINFNLRLATGGTNPTSTNETLGDSFQTDPIDIDLAYITYKPEAMKNYGVEISLGKLKNPFMTPGKTELIWDGDLTLEGGSLKLKFDVDPATVFVNCGGFWALENGASADVGLWGIQGGVQYPVNEEVKVVGGVSGYFWANEDLEGPINGLGGNTESADVAGTYKYEYNLIEAFAEVHFKLQDIPFNVFVDFVQNGDPSEEDTGWLFGFKCGKLKEQWDWDFHWNYRQVEMDAVLSGTTDSDFGDGQTNAQGHEFGFGLRLMKNTDLKVSYFVDEVFVADNDDDGTDDMDHDLLQIDFEFKF